MQGWADVAELKLHLRNALTCAMKERDTIAVRVLRSALAAIDNAEAVDLGNAPAEVSGPIAGAVRGVRAGDVARRRLTTEQAAAILQAEVTGRQVTAAEYERLGQDAEANRLRAEAAVLLEHYTDYLPS